jgi:hypothetical protein
MIRPNVRASFGRREAAIMLTVAGPEGEERLRQEGFDALLDDALLVRKLLQRRGIELTPAPLLFYLLVRHALLEREIHDRQLADYTAAILLEFGRVGRPDPFRREALPDTIYLTDILKEIDRARGGTSRSGWGESSRTSSLRGSSDSVRRRWRTTTAWVRAVSGPPPRWRSR